MPALALDDPPSEAALFDFSTNKVGRWGGEGGEVYCPAKREANHDEDTSARK